VLPLPEEDASVLGLCSQSLLDGGSLGDCECLAVCWSMGSINVCELVKTVASFLGKGLSGERSLQVDRVNERVVAGIRRKLTSHAGFLTPMTSLGASEDPDSSNVASMSTTRS